MNSTRGALALSDAERTDDRLKLVLEEGGQTHPFEFDLEEITIGRTADNPVRISDALSSRHHCQVRRGDGGWVVADLKSRNGTKLNGETLTAERVLTPGDRIEVGDSIIHFVEKRGAKPAAKPSVKTKRREKPEAAAEPAGPALSATDAVEVRVESTDQRAKLAPLPFVIGRKKSCGLALEHADVSNEHCMIVEDGGALLLVDLGSTNGTFLDGERLRGRAPLRAGAQITLGPKLELRIDVAGAAAAPKKAAAAKEPPKSDRNDKSVPKSDRHDKPAKAAPKGSSARAEKPKPAPAAVDEVDDLDALESSPEEKPAKRAGTTRHADPDDTNAAAMVAGEGDVAAEDFTSRLEAAASGQAPGGGGGAALVVMALLLVVGAVGATAATTLVARPEGDPRPPEGRIENWSFEDARGPGAGGVPDWELAADSAFLVQEGVAYGKHALALQAEPGARPEFRSAAPFRVTPERAYRVRAAVSLDARVGAALRVDWSAEGDPTFARTSWAVVLDPAQQGSPGWRDVGGTVVAPRGATFARVTGVALASADGPAGRARFDRVHLIEVVDAVPPFVLDGPAGLSATVDERGLVSLLRAGRELAAEVGLAVDPADPLAHQRAARVDQPAAPQPDESFLALGAIPEPSGARVDYAMSVGPDGGGLRLRWTTGPRAAPLHVVFVLPRLDDVAPIELDGKDVTQDLPAAPVSVSEMAWGKAAGQVSFRFTATATLTLKRVGAGAELSFAIPPRPMATGESGVGLDLGAASSGTLEQIKRLFDEAETASAAGDHARALDAYRRLMTRFSHDPSVVARAKKATEDALQRADRLAEVVEWAQKEAQDLPVPPLASAARSAVEELERGFDGTTQLERARRTMTRVDEAVAAGKKREQTQRVRELMERAQRLREAGHLNLARMIYQGILDHVDEAIPGVADAKAKLAALPSSGGSR